MTDSAKYGARHSAKDQELIRSIRQGARDIDQAALDLGADEGDAPPQEQAPAKSTLAIDAGDAVIVWGIVKAAGDWTLDVLGIPYGSAANKDSDGEWFDAQTKTHADKWPLPPAVYYHGFSPDRKPMGEPQYIGPTIKRWVDQAGEWFRVVLDKSNEFARLIWEAAQKGTARASSGSIAHLVRIEASGHIREWPAVELSLIDAEGDRQPANRYAVAIPTAKAIYKMAGLDDSVISPEAEPEAGHPAATAAVKHTLTEATEMDAIEMQKAVAEAVAAAMKAKDDEAKVKAEADAVAAIKAENEALKAKVAEAGRLPGGAAPYATKFGYAAKYDNLTPAEHAMVVGILSSPGKATKGPLGDEIVRALALKCESEAAKDAGAAEAFRAIKSRGIKADEIMHSDLSSYGSNWVGSLYSKGIWDAIRAECWVLQRLQPFADQVPDGYSVDYVPLESTDPTWYKVAEASDHTSGRPDVTVTSSQVTTALSTAVTLVKMGCRVTFSGELVEDSLVPLAPQIMRQMKQSGLEQFEHAIIDGDTETSSSTNINSIGGAVSATATYMLVNGFRKIALVTGSGMSRSAGTLEDTDFLETAKLLGTAGMAADVNKVTLISDMPTYWKALQLANVKSKDVFTQATIEGGQLKRIWGFEYMPSAFMHYKSTARKANSAGKVDQTTPTNNVYGAILAVRWDQWRMKWKRQMTMETDRWPESDTNQIVAMARWGLGYRDTSAAVAESYGVGL